MLENKPKIVTISNVSQFFNISSVNPSGIKKGMIVEFNYNSPDHKIHDRKPLVFVMENYSERIIGLNLHYQFGIVSKLLQLKDQQLKEFMYNSREYKKYLDELKKESKVDLAEGNLPDPIELESQGKQFDYKKVRFPQQLLEDFTSDITASETIFRNYLFKRMSGLKKLYFKL